MVSPHLSFVFLLAAGSIVAATLAGGCLSDAPAPDNQVIRTIPPDQASALIEENRENPNFVIVDVRGPDEFAAGHIPGAVNINSANFEEHIGSLDPEAVYLICCQKGGRSAGVREMMWRPLSEVYGSRAE